MPSPPARVQVGPGDALVVRAIVDREPHLAVGRKDPLRGDRALQEHVVGVVRHLLQAKRHEEVADPQPPEPRYLVDRKVGVLDVRGRDCPQRLRLGAACSLNEAT